MSGLEWPLACTNAGLSTRGSILFLRIVIAAALSCSLASYAQPDAKAVVNAGKKPALTQEQYKKLILALEGCKLTGYSIDPKCQALLDMYAVMKNTTTGLKDMAGMNAALGQELITHPAPAVRVKAGALMGGLLGSSDSSGNVIAAAAEKETDPGVLQSFLRVTGNSGGKNKKVAEMLIKAGSHPDVKVRTQAIYAIASPWNREMAGAAEKLLEMASKDADPSVRAAACEYIGELNNKIALPFIEKATGPRATDQAMYNACLKGLVRLFHYYPLYDTSNEAAYKLFVKRLNDKPRTADRPYWTVTSLFERANDDKHAALAKWKAEAKWFKPAEMKKALVGVIADKKANWMARNGAIKSMVGLGATKAELEALKKGYDEKVSDDKLVLKAITEAVAKAP